MEITLLALLFLLGILLKIKSNRYSAKRERRKCESPIEEQLFDALIEKGYQVYTQVPCRNYRIDLAIYVKGKRLAIEADGKKYHSSKKAVQHDDTKDFYLRKDKWDVMRFTGSEIYRNAKGCAIEVEKRLQMR